MIKTKLQNGFNNSLSRKVILLLPALLYFTAAFTQLSIEPFRGSKRFPSEELHGIVEDDQGNKWVASDAGLIKITGNVVNVFTRKDGLASDVILKVYKDPKGRIWLSGADASLSIIENGKIRSIPANAELRKMGAISSGVNSMYLGTDGCLYGTFFEGRVPQYKLSEDMQHVTWADADTARGIGRPFAGLSPDLLQEERFLKTMQSVDTNLLKQWRFSDLMSRMRAWCYTSDSCLYVGYMSYVFQFRNFTLLHRYELPFRVYAVMEVKGKLIAATASSGMYELKNGYSLPVKSELSKRTLTSIYRDKEDNYWFTTLERGLFVMRQPDLDIMYDDDVNITKFVSIEDKTNLLLTDKRLINALGEEEHILPYHPYDLRFIFSYGKETISNIFYFSSEGLQVSAGRGMSTLSKQYFATSFNLPHNRFVFTGGRNLTIYDRKKGIIGNLLFKERIMCGVPETDSTLLAGTFSSGLLRVHFGRVTAYEAVIPQGRINCMARINSNEVAVGTNEDGIQVISNQGVLLRQYRNLPNRIQVLTYAAPFLYAGTKEGLYIIDLVRQTVMGFNNSNGLPFDEVRDIVVKNGSVFIAGRNMAAFIPAAGLAGYTSLLKIDIKEAMVNNNKRDIAELGSLSSRLNNFTFSIDNYSYRSAFNTIYHYNVIEDGKIILSDSSSAPSVNFSLEPGKYTVHVYATDRLLHSRSNDIRFPVSIAIPYYRKAWFLVSLAVLFVLVVTIITVMIVRRIKSRERKKRELVMKLSDLEARALQGQMNPHFIFNAVNSIQDFILNNRNEEAHIFLSAFASLIRMVLEHNRKKTVTIDEEVALLRLYVSIEEQRLKDQVRLGIDIPADMDADNILLPSMLLQPLVENAIWHGLSSESGEKTIHIGFETMEEDLLKIKISDNGKGLNTIGKSHEPVGLDIVKERIRLAYEKEPGFPFFSISNQEDNRGVIVQIILPLQTAY